jgi:hypothetical protein
MSGDLERAGALHAVGAQVLIPGAGQIARIVVFGADAQPELGIFDQPQATERVAGDGVQISQTKGKAHHAALRVALVRQGVGAGGERRHG